MGYSRWGQKELDVTELLTLALACVWNECGETNCGIFTEWNAAAAAAKSLQSCPTLCNPLDGSPPGPAVPGILQARTLEWVAISSSNA